MRAAENLGRFTPPLAADSTANTWFAHPEGGPWLREALADTEFATFMADPRNGQMLRVVPVVPPARMPGFPVTEAEMAEVVERLGSRSWCWHDGLFISEAAALARHETGLGVVPLPQPTVTSPSATTLQVRAAPAVSATPSRHKTVAPSTRAPSRPGIWAGHGLRLAARNATTTPTPLRVGQ